MADIGMQFGGFFSTIFSVVMEAVCIVLVIKTRKQIVSALNETLGRAIDRIFDTNSAAARQAQGLNDAANSTLPRPVPPKRPGPPKDRDSGANRGALDATSRTFDAARDLDDGTDSEDATVAGSKDPFAVSAKKDEKDDLGKGGSGGVSEDGSLMASEKDEEDEDHTASDEALGKAALAAGAESCDEALKAAEDGDSEALDAQGPKDADLGDEEALAKHGAADLSQEDPSEGKDGRNPEDSRGVLAAGADRSESGLKGQEMNGRPGKGGPDSAKEAPEKDSVPRPQGFEIPEQNLQEAAGAPGYMASEDPERSQPATAGQGGSKDAKDAIASPKNAELKGDLAPQVRTGQKVSENYQNYAPEGREKKMASLPLDYRLQRRAEGGGWAKDQSPMEGGDSTAAHEQAKIRAGHYGKYAEQAVQAANNREAARELAGIIGSSTGRAQLLSATNPEAAKRISYVAQAIAQDPATYDRLMAAAEQGGARACGQITQDAALRGALKDLCPAIRDAHADLARAIYKKGAQVQDTVTSRHAKAWLMAHPESLDKALRLSAQISGSWLKAAEAATDRARGAAPKKELFQDGARTAVRSATNSFVQGYRQGKSQKRG